MPRLTIYNGFDSLGSDHRVVSMKVGLSLQMPRQKSKRLSYDWKCFARKPDMQEQYSVEVRHRFSLLDDAEEDLTARYQMFIDANDEATKACVTQRVSLKWSEIN